MAMIIGVPFGSWLALAFNWQMPFWIVAIVAFLAALLIRLLFPLVPSSGVVSLQDRLAFMKRPEIILALFTTLAWGIGIFSVYTYIAEIFIGLGAAEKTISLILLIAGIANFIGASLGGFSVDRIGSPRTIAISLPLLIVALIAFSILGSFPYFDGVVAAGIASAVLLWGVSTLLNSIDLWICQVKPQGFRSRSMPRSSIWEAR
ncbi:hypothetical protein MALU111345_20660 [Marinicrinis lubricantis]